jgi:MOSC domain-containing protein YiiM
MSGSIISIFIAPGAGAPMISVNEARLEEGLGIVGDRYYSDQGTFSEKLKGGPDSEITLIESEQIDNFNRLNGLKLNYGSLRRNVVTQGIDLNKLVNVRFRIGETLLEGIRLCEPCTHLASLVSEKVLPGLVHRGGLRARIVSGGSIRPADSINVT